MQYRAAFDKQFRKELAEAHNEIMQRRAKRSRGGGGLSSFGALVTTRHVRSNTVDLERVGLVLNILLSRSSSTEENSTQKKELRCRIHLRGRLARIPAIKFPMSPATMTIAPHNVLI